MVLCVGGESELMTASGGDPGLYRSPVRSRESRAEPAQLSSAHNNPRIPDPPMAE
ncbi:MAG: hypothetical protein LUQ40_05745 [Methanomicrobiales archaeon]|nr:hypothetical protein [Methanomicrobiales archaeon]